MHSGHLSTLASSSPTSGGFGLIGGWPASYLSLRRFAMRAQAAWSSATRPSLQVNLISLILTDRASTLVGGCRSDPGIPSRRAQDPLALPATTTRTRCPPTTRFELKDPVH